MTTWVWYWDGRCWWWVCDFEWFRGDFVCWVGLRCVLENVLGLGLKRRGMGGKGLTLFCAERIQWVRTWRRWSSFWWCYEAVHSLFGEAIRREKHFPPGKWIGQNGCAEVFVLQCLEFGFFYFLGYQTVWVAFCHLGSWAKLMKINFFYIGFKSWRLRLKLAKLLSWALLSGFTFFFISQPVGNERVDVLLRELRKREESRNARS